MLAFEPPDWRSLLGSSETQPTLGGALACNLSGPRRIKAGAARDHFLGFRAVSGRGEIFKSGGKVVKNVTGYDLSKLMAGSFGTLAALEEVTIKVLPQPEHVVTVVLCGMDPAAAAQAMSRALSSPHDVSGAAYLPANSPMTAAAETVALRLEGPEPSVAFRRERLLAEFGGRMRVHRAGSRRLGQFLARDPRCRTLRGADGSNRLAGIGSAGAWGGGRRGDRARCRRGLVSRLGGRARLGGSGG